MNRKNKKISMVQMLLTILYITSYMIANVITSKQVQLPFGIVMTGAVLIFPITYVISDMISEIYGYRWSRITCYLAFGANLYMVALFMSAMAMPSPSYWTNQAAFETVLGSTPRILAASFTAFLIGGLINDKIFKKFKDKHADDKGFSFRAILSTLMGELADSFIFLPLAFWGQMPGKTLLIMTITQVVIKTGYEVVVLPLTKWLIKKINNYEARYLSV